MTKRKTKKEKQDKTAKEQRADTKHRRNEEKENH